MNTMEAQNKQEEVTAQSEIKNIGKEMGEKAANNLGNKLQQRMEDLKKDRLSESMLNDFKKDQEKSGNTIDNEKVKNALDNPKDKDKVKAMQEELKSFYNPKFDQKTQSVDVQTAFTLGAINTMIANRKQAGEIKAQNISSLAGVNDFIGILHPYFYGKFEKIDLKKLEKGSNEEKIANTMNRITNKDATITRVDIQDMQVALNNANYYPPTHKKPDKDGEPGPYTQVALQTFVFKNLKDTPTTT